MVKFLQLLSLTLTCLAMLSPLAVAAAGGCTLQEPASEASAAAAVQDLDSLLLLLQTLGLGRRGPRICQGPAQETAATRTATTPTSSAEGAGNNTRIRSTVLPTSTAGGEEEEDSAEARLLWLTLGRGLMVGLGCEDVGRLRSNPHSAPCLYRRDCMQMVEQAVNPQAPNRRHVRAASLKTDSYARRGHYDVHPDSRDLLEIRRLEDSAIPTPHPYSGLASNDVNSVDPYDFQKRVLAWPYHDFNEDRSIDKSESDGIHAVAAAVHLKHRLLSPRSKEKAGSALRYESSEHPAVGLPRPMPYKGILPLPSGILPGTGHQVPGSRLPPHPQTRWWILQDQMYGRGNDEVENEREKAHADDVEKDFNQQQEQDNSRAERERVGESEKKEKPRRRKENTAQWEEDRPNQNGFETRQPKRDGGSHHSSNNHHENAEERHSNGGSSEHSGHHHQQHQDWHPATSHQQPLSSRSTLPSTIPQPLYPTSPSLGSFTGGAGLGQTMVSTRFEEDEEVKTDDHGVNGWEAVKVWPTPTPDERERFFHVYTGRTDDVEDERNALKQNSQDIAMLGGQSEGSDKFSDSWPSTNAPVTHLTRILSTLVSTSSENSTAKEPPPLTTLTIIPSPTQSANSGLGHLTHQPGESHHNNFQSNLFRNYGPGILREGTGPPTHSPTMWPKPLLVVTPANTHNTSGSSSHGHNGTQHSHGSHNNQQQLTQLQQQQQQQHHLQQPPSIDDDGSNPVNHSAIASRVLFAMLNQHCGGGDQEFRYASPVAWVEAACQAADRSPGMLWALEALELKLVNALDRWDSQRFLDIMDDGGNYVTDDASLIPIPMCFNIRTMVGTIKTQLSLHNHITPDSCRPALNHFLSVLSASVIAHLLQGHKLSSNTCPEYFVSSLFGQYGEGYRRPGCLAADRTYLNAEGLQAMLSDAVSFAAGNFSDSGNGSRSDNTSSGQSDNVDGDLPETAPTPISNGPHVERPDNDHDDDKERRKRRVTVAKRSWGFTRSPATQTLTARQLLDVVFSNRTSRVTVRQFYQLCPALLHQVLHHMHRAATERLSDSALDRSADLMDEETIDRMDKVFHATAFQTYGLGTAAVAVMTLCSLLGALLVRCGQAVGRHYAMAAMLALAAGSLSADAILHLLPEALGLTQHHRPHGTHARDESGHGRSDDVSEGGSLGGGQGLHHLPGGFMLDDVRLKGLALLVSIYLFWLLEVLCCKFSHSKNYSTQFNRRKNPDTGIYVVPMTMVPESTDVGHVGQSRDNTYEPVMPPQTVLKPAADRGDFAESSQHLAWLVVVGDAVHNLVDGLAIGAAFAHSVPLGISTSMAVVCHEIPHEIGDMAVLLATGKKLSKALLLNLLSALTAFVGLYAGIAVGGSKMASHWLFVVVAGMFLYIALASLVPELVRYYRHFMNAGMFVLQSLGILLGFGLMLLLALVEDKLHI